MRVDENGIPHPALQEQIAHYFGWLDRIDPASAPHNPETRLQDYLRSLPSLQQVTPVEQLAEQRRQLRQQKRWADADRLRRQIESAGYQIIDTESGFTLIPHS